MFLKTLLLKMSENNSNNRNADGVDATGRGPLRSVQPARSEPSISSPSAPPSGEVTKRINALQSELATRTLEFEDVRANYEQAFFEAVYASRDIDELRAELSTLR